MLNNRDGAPSNGWEVRRARNWNREPVSLMWASLERSLATVCPTDDLTASNKDNQNAEIYLLRRKTWWRRTLQERGHRNHYGVMKPGPVDLLSLSPGGKRLAASSHLWGYGDHEEDLAGFCELGLVLFDTKSGRQIARQSAFEGAFADVAWSPDSSQIAGITEDGWAFVLDATTGKLRFKFRAHGLWGACIAWSPDGKTLVTASNPRLAWSPTHIEFALKSSGGTLMMSGTEGTITEGRIHDKNRLVIAQNKIGDATWNGRTERLLKRFDARTGTQIGSAIPLQTGAVDIAFSPDGRQLALGEHEFALLLNAQTLATERRLDIPKPTTPGSSSVPAPVCLAWSEDGSTLATSTSRGLTLWRVR